jgi:hypothetical protein
MTCPPELIVLGWVLLAAWVAGGGQLELWRATGVLLGG